MWHIKESRLRLVRLNLAQLLGDLSELVQEVILHSLKLILQVLHRVGLVVWNVLGLVLLS